MRSLILLTSIFLAFTFTSCSNEKYIQPNIVIIYADDMGYGDLNCQNSKSKIPTPNLDKLASEGIRFTDAHSSSGICSPSRFALLTGTYHWRRQHGIVGAFGKPFFKDSDVTLPQILKTKNYTTACIGKWHLGWDWKFNNEPTAEVQQWKRKVKFYLPEDVDWRGPIGGGPLDRGFDYYFGDGTINFPPYAWMENDQLIEQPTQTMDISNIGYETKEGSWEFRPGPKVKDWNPYDVLPTLTAKTVEWINKRDATEPFFLYFALPSPHAPIIPNDEFDGKSEAGAYGDFIVQSDWVAGQVLQALKDKGLEENTIVIFSADNGTEAYAWKRAEKFGHYSMGNFRGLKRDVWEGGHHVPFIVKWPGNIEAGSVSNELISQVDIMATLASMTEIDLPENSAPDSYNFLPVLKGEEYNKPLREVTIHNTYESKWGIRKGDWLYINSSSGGHRKLPESFKELTGYTDFITEGVLFNMKDDPEQRVNLYEKYPEKIIEMEKQLVELAKENLRECELIGDNFLNIVLKKRNRMNDNNNFAKAEMAIRKPVEEVFDAFIHPEQTTKFWFTDSTGKLEEEAKITWTWAMYNVSIPVVVQAIDKHKRIEIQWGEGAQQSNVIWEFKSINPELTYVSVTNLNFKSEGDDLVSQIRDSTGGFSYLLASLKAWLEHDIKLNLVQDKFPREMMNAR